MWVGALATVFRPERKTMADAGYASVAHVPVLFDTRHRYLDDHNRYLRERALLEWHPSVGGTATEKRLAGRGRLAYPRMKTLIDYAYALANWVEWAEWQDIDWRTGDYEALILSYDADMRAGRWSAGGRPLSASTRNLRTDRAVEFLCWAADRGLRPPFRFPVGTVSRHGDRGDRAGGHKAVVTEQRAGRARPDPSDLRLPRPEEIRSWLASVRVRRGYTKHLACKTILMTGLRRRELASLQEDALPPPDCWHVVGDKVRVRITEGTKGGRSRWIDIPVALAQELDAYREGRRLKARAKWLRANRGQAAPRQLFLSENDGRPLTAESLYEAWTVGAPFPSWSPHLGRHAWACLTLADRMKDEAHKARMLLAQMPEAWFYSVGQSVIDTTLRPQLGHMSRDTTLKYLRWAMEATALTEQYGEWAAFLDEGGLHG